MISPSGCQEFLITLTSSFFDSFAASCAIIWNRFDENPNCSFAKERMNFALHVRMGDRRNFFERSAREYAKTLEEVMNNITAEVVDMSLPKPLFHIFSETVHPCPSAQTGLFDEFPTWRVESDQVCFAKSFHIIIHARGDPYFLSHQCSSCWRPVGAGFVT